MMKLVFFGTPYFAIPSLNALHKSTHEICAVVTVPDKRYGRGLKKTSSPVKKTAEGLNYSIYQPPDLKDPDFLSIINKIDADIFVVVAYRILPNSLISIPQEGAINIHASLLPKYRGAAPIHRAILNGENETGVTAFKIQKTVDTGDILLQENYKLSKNITTGEVYDSLASIGAKLIVTTLDRLEKNELISIPQDHASATSAPKITSDDCLIDWHKSTDIIHNQIRAFSSKPGAYTYLKKKRVKLFNTKIKNNSRTAALQPGEINYTNACLEVGTGNGIIHIYEIQIEGKKRLSVRQFVAGLPQIKGDYFG